MRKKYQPPRIKVERLKLHTQFCNASATLGKLEEGGELDNDCNSSSLGTLGDGGELSNSLGGNELWNNN